jgi:hypothetical protein
MIKVNFVYNLERTLFYSNDQNINYQFEVIGGDNMNY